MKEAIRKILIIFVLVVLSLVKFVSATVVCDSGSFSTTCIINTSQGIAEGEVISGSGNLVVTSIGSIFNNSGGNINISMGGNLTIQSGGSISTFYSSSPGAGNINILVANLFLEGEIKSDGGPAGTVSIVTDSLNITGDVFSKGYWASKPRDGGDVNITASKLYLSGSIITDGVDDTEGNGGHAGDLIITCLDSITLSGSSIISANGARGASNYGCVYNKGHNGNGGFMIFDANELELHGTVSSIAGTGGACKDGTSGPIELFFVDSNLNLSGSNFDPLPFVQEDKECLCIEYTDCVVEDFSCRLDGDYIFDLFYTGDRVIVETRNGPLNLTTSMLNMTSNSQIRNIGNNTMNIETNYGVIDKIDNANLIKSIYDLNVIGVVDTVTLDVGDELNVFGNLYSNFTDIEDSLIVEDGGYFSVYNDTKFLLDKLLVEGNLLGKGKRILINSSITDISGLLDVSEKTEEAPAGQIEIFADVLDIAGTLTADAVRGESDGGNISIVVKNFSLSGTMTSNGGIHMDKSGGDGGNIIIYSEEFNIDYSGIINADGARGTDRVCSITHGHNGNGGLIEFYSINHGIHGFITSIRGVGGACDDGTQGPINVYYANILNVTDAIFIPDANFILWKNPPSIDLESPENNTLIDRNNTILFEYYVSDKVGISNCSLVIDNQINLVDNQVENDQFNYFTQTLSNGQYTWSVNCTDSSVNIMEGESESFILTVLTCVDNDNDGYGVGNTTSCTYSEEDCDDNNADVNPGATEICNGIDDDCDSVVDEDGELLCTDGEYCTGVEWCDGVNGCQPGIPIDCSFLDDQCNDGYCNENNDQCEQNSTPYEGLGCDDSYYCNVGETCQSGICTGGSARDCGDNVTCTDDSCDEENDVCVNTVNDANCDNALYCDGIEYCDSELDCQDGTAIDCSDTEFCTVNERCDEDTDKCLYDDRDCSANDIDEISTCDNDPDNNPFTFDYREAFTSVCDEVNDLCTTGDSSISHTCDYVTCSATCDATHSCADTGCDDLDGCVDNDYYDYDNVSNSCLGDCTCENNACTQYTVYENDPRCGCTDEICDDDVDNDCDGQIDEGYLTVKAYAYSIDWGTRPIIVKEPIVDMDVRVFDISQGSCARDIGLLWWNYEDIWNNCTEQQSCVTDSNGECDMDVAEGSYIIIGEYIEDSTITYTASILGNLGCDQQKQRTLIVIKRAFGRSLPGRSTERTGSLLYIIEPEYIDWDEETELYPFVFETEGDWDVTVTVEPPEGFVADYESLSEEVNSGMEAVQFNITDIGSDWIPTKVTYEIKHKGKKEKLEKEIGVAMSEELAKKKELYEKEDRIKKGFNELKIIDTAEKQKKEMEEIEEKVKKKSKT